MDRQRIKGRIKKGTGAIKEKAGKALGDHVATQVAQHGSGMPVPDWARLLRCTECGERDADFVVSGARR